MRSIEAMRLTRDRLARAACAALNTAVALRSESFSMFHEDHASPPASGAATSRKPHSSRPKNERG